MIQAPDDSAKILETLIKASESVLSDVPLYRRLLLKGALIDAKDLLAEIRGEERIDTHVAAVKALHEEVRKP